MSSGFSGCGLRYVFLAWFLGGACVASAQEADSILAKKRQHLRQAATHAQQIEDEDLRTRVFYALTRAQASATATDDALKSAAQVTGNSQLQIYSYLAVARQQKQAGDMAAAREAGELARQTAIFANAGKGRVDTHLIDWLASNNLVEEGLDYLRQIKTKTSRNFGIQMLCAKLGEVEGGADRALEVLQNELPSQYHDPTLLMMTGYCSRVGPADQALRYVKKIRDPALKDKAWLELVTRQRAKGVKENVLQPWISQMQDGPLKDRAKAQAVASQDGSAAADVASLEKRIGETDNRPERLALQENLLKRFLADQKPKLAEAVIGQMVETIDKYPQPKQSSKFGSVDDQAIKQTLRSKLIRVASVYDAQGAKPEAERCRKLAMEAVKSIPDSAGISKLFAVQAVAGELNQTGQSELALQLMKEANAKGPFQAMQVRGSVASLIAKGKWDEAVAAVMEQAQDKNGYWRSQAVIEAAKLAIAKKRLDVIPDFLAALAKTDDDYKAYREVSAALVAADQNEVLTELLKEAPPAAKAYAEMGRAAAVGK